MSLSIWRMFLPAPFAEPPDEILDEQWNILRSLAQRRNRDWERHSIGRRDPGGKFRQRRQPAGHDWWPLSGGRLREIG